MNITLIGFMGSGKTTVGKVLAEKMGLDFADLDSVIESSEKSSIADIFKTKGEDYFRELERDALNSLLKKDNLLIATGGGTPCFFDNLANINKNSISIYLKMSADSLFERLKNEPNHRPLIKDLKDKELRLFISDLLATREPFYLGAH